MEDSFKKNTILVRPIVSIDEAKKIVFDLFGLTVTKISVLNGYDDKNFHILVSPDVKNNQFIENIFDCGYVLKISNTLDSQNDIQFAAQTELLLHLNKNGIKCSRPVLTKDQKPLDKIRLSSGEHVVRLLEYISGEILFKIPATSKTFFEVGVLAAKIDNALQEFDHPAYHKNIKWCLGSAPDILNYLSAVKDQRRQILVTKTIQEFTSRVLSIEDKLDKGIIHGDINEQNILVEQVKNNLNIKAIIDYGDTHYACYLYELAIAMTYMIFTSSLIDSGGFVLAGYCSVRKVPEQELELLRICVLTRFCQSLVLGAHASLQEPENQYILTTQESGWELFEQMIKMSERSIFVRWMSIAEPFNFRKK